MFFFGGVGEIRGFDPSTVLFSREEFAPDRGKPPNLWTQDTANTQTKNLDFKGFDSVRFLCLRGGITRSIGNFPKSRLRDA